MQPQHCMPACAQPQVQAGWTLEGKTILLLTFPVGSVADSGPFST